ncbi:MAG: class I SAM-dependent methyltransferase [Candidatus Kapabacteria bacterium]|nr:class I SAM-dependent methyltransferase [Candidatus Kapabacteria bacterium]
MKFGNKNLVSAFDELPLWSAPFGLLLLDKISMKKNMKVLDIGFGAGFPVFEIAGRLGDSCLVYGIDLWEEAIERAVFKNEIYGYKNVILLNRSILDSGFEDNFFDMIVSNNGLNNVDNFTEAINVCNRILKPGGELVFTQNLPETMLIFNIVFEDLLNSFGLIEEIGKFKDYIFEKRKPKEYIFKILENSGFIISESTESEFIWRFIDGSAFLKQFFIRLAFKENWENLIPQSVKKEFFIALEKRLNEYSNKKGELSINIPFICIKATKL